MSSSITLTSRTFTFGKIILAPNIKLKGLSSSSSVLLFSSSSSSRKNSSSSSNKSFLLFQKRYNSSLQSSSKPSSIPPISSSTTTSSKSTHINTTQSSSSSSSTNINSTFTYGIDPPIATFNQSDHEFRKLIKNLTDTGKLKNSHVIGDLDTPLYENTTGRFMLELAQQYGQNTALVSVHQNKRLTYQELHDISSVIGINIVRKLNIKRGDRVGVCAGNLWEYPALQMALGKIGAVLVPLNPAFTDTQFHAALNSSETKALFIQSHLSRGARKTSRDITGLIKAATDGNILPSIKNVVLLDSFSTAPELTDEIVEVDGDQIRWFKDMLEEPTTSSTSTSVHEAPEINHILDPIEDAKFANETNNMQFTSGTTAMPKISCLTHRNLVNNGRLIGERLNLSATKSNHPSGQDFLCAPVPMFHCFGLILTNMAAFSQGAALVYAAEAFDARKTMQAVRQEKCTGLQGVPTMFAAEMELHDELEQGGHELLSKGICAGSSVPIEMMRRVISTLNLNQLTICYGMTETSPVSFMTTPADTIERRCETVGSIMPHTEARIIKSAPTDIDPQHLNLAPVPVNEKGEIVISGYLLQKWYHNAPDKTAEAMVTDPETGKRWMRTGDEGVIDEYGYLKVTGRIKDLIIRGGENIHPLEIENVLFEHPAVSQASVVGVPDDHYGEAVAAFIVLHEEYHSHHSKESQAPTSDEIRLFVKEKLGHYMAPKYVFYVPDFPKTASGKIRKVDLKGTAETLVKQGHGN